MNKNITTEQLESIVIDAGVVYINYGETGEKLLAPTRGGNSFTVEQEIRQIERDGARGKEKGLRRVVEENATLTVNTLDLSVETLKLALAGAVKTGDKIESGEGTIAEEEYLKNVTLIGEDMAGNHRVIQIFNALGDNGLNIETNDRDESVVSIELSANWNPEDYSEPLYKIETVTPSP